VLVEEPSPRLKFIGFKIERDFSADLIGFDLSVRDQSHEISNFNGSDVSQSFPGSFQGNHRGVLPAKVGFCHEFDTLTVLAI
jgi:hypothetical protein